MYQNHHSDEEHRLSQKDILEILENEYSMKCPDLAEHLRSIADNMRDLYAPFSSGHYYCKEMGGSRSIKAVLPAFFPKDPELDYTKLGLIQNGSNAMEAFASLHEKPPDEALRIRAALLAYCKLDTLALVKITERLRELAV